MITRQGQPTTATNRPVLRDPRTLYLSSFMLVGLSIVALGPALTELRERSGSDIGSIGVLFSAQAVGYIIGSLGAGPLLDRLPGHRVFAGSLTLLGIGLAAVPSVRSLSGLIIVFAIMGIGASGVDVGANVLLIWDRGAAVGRSMNLLHLSFGVGALIAPLVVRLSLDLTTRVAGLLALCLAIWALGIPAPRFVAEPREEHGPTTNTVLALGTFFFIMYVGLEVGFAGWVTTYGEEIGFSTDGATWLTTTFWVTFIVGRVGATLASERVLPKHVIAGSIVLTVIGAAVLVVSGGAPTPTWIGTVLLGFGMAAQFPAMMTYLERRFSVTGTATALFVSGAGIGQLLFPWMIGRWFDARGAEAVPVATLLLAAGTLAAFVAVNRELRPAR